MIDFLKGIFSSLVSLFKNDDNKEENKIKKIIYIAIIMCAIFFIGLIIFYTIKALPGFLNGVQENYYDQKSFLENNINIK